VYLPEFADNSSSESNLHQLGEDFFRGIDSYPEGRVLWHKLRLGDDGRKTLDSIDLGDLAVALFVRSIGYFVLACLAMVVVVILLSIFGPKSFSRVSGWPIVWGLWALLQFDIFRRLHHTAKSAPPYRATSHSIHKLEFCSAGFLMLYALARPYLADSDASAYPYVQTFFQFIVGAIAVFHLAVLAIFRRKPGVLDICALATAIGTAVFSLVR
jgi:hypothetical protein